MDRFQGQMQRNFLPRKNIKWVNKVKSLGAWISTDSGASIKVNYDEKIEKAQNVWRLSLLEKTVLKSLVGSQFVYILAPPAIKSYSLR